MSEQKEFIEISDSYQLSKLMEKEHKNILQKMYPIMKLFPEYFQVITNRYTDKCGRRRKCVLFNRDGLLVFIGNNLKYQDEGLGILIKDYLK